MDCKKNICLDWYPQKKLKKLWTTKWYKFGNSTFLGYKDYAESFLDNF